jgi:putative glycosyltransferase (TIGR04372 family)
LRQITAIKRHVIKLISKLINIFLRIFSDIFASIVILLLRILSPFLIVRLGILDSGRIGGMVNADWYLCENQLNTIGSKTIDIFLLIQSTNHRNHFWIRLWKRTKLYVIDFRKFDFIAKSIIRINQLFPASDKYSIPIKNHTWPPQGNTLKSIIAAKDKKYLYLTEQEKIKGNDILKSMGLAVNDKFICFHNRDSSFLDTVFAEQNWNFHDYRDSSINNYLAAADYLTKNGYYAIRLGHTTENKIVSTNSKIIDYSNSSYRSNFMDIYLLSQSYFSIFSETGLNQVDWVFRKPCLFVNWVLLKSTFFWQKGLFIPKKFYSRKQNRFLSFKEVIELVGSSGDGNIFENNGWVPIENTAQEILDACIEMNMRMNNEWHQTKDDEMLQLKYWDLYGKNLVRNSEFRIGTKFLRGNIELLER